MRLEMIGLSVTPQHSDARVMDQIIYKWRHTRRILAHVLAEKYADLADSGWAVTDAEIQGLKKARRILAAPLKRFDKDSQRI
jgi:hypothetical protein